MEERGKFVIRAKRYSTQNGKEILGDWYLSDSTKFLWNDINHACAWTRYSDVLRYLRALPADVVESRLHDASIDQLVLRSDGTYELVERKKGFSKKFIAQMERYRTYARKRQLFFNAQNAAYQDFRVLHPEFTKETFSQFKEYYGCSFCGNRAALEFHHVRRRIRRLKPSEIRSWEELEKELQIGIILCGPCHADLHKRFRYHTSETDDQSGDIL